jgi:16S rRNA G966 N2-methylase RsmD
MNNISPLSYFTQNKSLIFEHLLKRFGSVSIKNLDIYIYKNIKQCTNFYTPIVVNVLNYFKPKHYLDFSAGWGDRLIGAIAYGLKNSDFTYTGIDPSVCMYKRYKKIIKRLTHNDPRYQVFCKPFEDYEVEKDKYDLVFTSPPFFDLEIYENTDTQSLVRYNTINSWFDNFMKKAINNSIIALQSGGHLALYIGDSLNDSYVDKTSAYISSLKNIKYIGNLNWINKTSSKKLRVIRVWRKLPT